ncbi:signal peptidase I [Coleofasciculus chthonoplastes]|uniref:signal peptidase I n=1 Tax=Coleofasciculus chthonoplastes TaxID=64178 RepID=UPI0033022689
MKLIPDMQQGTPLLEQDIESINQCQERFKNFANDPFLSKVECINLIPLNFPYFLGASTPIEDNPFSLSRCKDFIETVYLPSSVSMQPNLQSFDYVLLDKTAYNSRLPQRSDIIFFQPTQTLREQNFTAPFVKRIIGLPGETVEINNGLVYINGQPLQEDYIEEAPEYQYGPVVIPDNHYLVLGDNRNNSYDSHYWGFVNRELIIGQVIAVIYPIGRLSTLNNFNLLEKETQVSIVKLMNNLLSLYSTFLSISERINNPEADEVESKIYVHSMNRAQQGFYLENGYFSSDLSELDLGIDSETENYSYNIIVTDDKQIIQNTGIAKTPEIKSYVGIIWIGKNDDTNEQTPLAILCESDRPTTTPPPKAMLPVDETQEPTCPPGYSSIE